MSRRMKSLRPMLELLLLLGLPALLVVAVWQDFEHTALLSILAVCLALASFFSRFEKRRPQPRDIVPVVVMSVLAVIGRALLVVFPNVQPVTAIVILSGIAFGPQAGFVTGALSALTSNLLLGQGPWTPWQMFGWGLAGYLAGHLPRQGQFHRPAFVYLYGIVISFVYGMLLNVWVVIGFVRPFSFGGAFLIYLASLHVDIMHAASTLVFLLLLRRPWLKKLERIKRKYGLLDDLI